MVFDEKAELQPFEPTLNVCLESGQRAICTYVRNSMAAPHRTQTELFSESRAGLSSHPPSAIVSAKPNPIILSIKPSYLEALQALGYCESEARFLYVVATHSGYFVARQFLAFTSGHWGKRATAFWHKLHTKKHARTEHFPMNRKVYHVFSRKPYGQIGRENLRNRREHEFEYIQKRSESSILSCPIRSANTSKPNLKS
jgi:hypothetical protein